MRTLLPDPPPAPFEELLRRRRETGADRHDEVWEGVLHMAPAAHGRHSLIQHQLAVLLDGPARVAGLQPAIAEFNLGDPDDYRVPDGGLHRPGPSLLYYPSAALVVEIVSRGDETWEKFPFYAAHGVDELLIVDPLERAVHWFALRDGDYGSVERSTLIECGPGALVERLEWPAGD